MVSDHDTACTCDRCRMMVMPTTRTVSERVFVVFDGPPSHEAGRFVEVETADGKGRGGIAWTERDGYWLLGPFVRAECSDALAARMAELEAENAKLRACVKASDDARGDGCCPVCDSEAGASHWIDCPWRDYDAARAEVDKP